MNARLNPDTFYVNGNAIPATYFQGLDSAQSQAVNADAGGTWSPSSAIGIDGAGMWATGPWSLGGSPSIEAPSGDSLWLTHGDNDWVELGSGHAASTRTLRRSLGTAADTSYWTPGNPTNGQPSLAMAAATQGAVVQGVASSFLGGARLTMPLRVHNGASLVGAAVALYFVIGNAHSGGLPASFPQMRVLRIDMFGNAVPLGTDPTVPGWLGDGWQSVFGGSPPASPSAYYNSGTEWGVTYTCDAGTVVDTSRFAYVVQVLDESGTGSMVGNVFFAEASGNSLIQDLRPQ